MPTDTPWLIVFGILLAFAAIGLGWHIVEDILDALAKRREE